MNLESNSQFVDELRDALFRNVNALCQLTADRDAARGACTAVALQDAERYAFAKTLEGQVVVMETLKSHGAEALDQALDDAMAEELENRDE